MKVFIIFNLLETVEQSSSSKTKFDTEVGRLQAYIHELQNEITELKAEKLRYSMNQQNNVAQDTSSLAPSVVLSAATKKLLKKLDAFSTQDNVEDSKVLVKLYITAG